MFEVITVKWERANLHLLLNDKVKNKNVYLSFNNKKIPLEVKENEIILNVTNVEGSMLDSGSWAIYVGDKKVCLSDELISNIDDYSRIFKYKKNNYSYEVLLEIDQDKYLYINTEFMMINRKPKKFIRLNEGKNLLGKIKVFLISFSFVLFNILYKFFRLFKFSSNKILFLTENSDYLNNNLLALYDEVKDDFDVTVFSKNVHSRGLGVLSSIKEIFMIARSDKIIIDNHVKFLTVINISKKTKIIQLWHAGVGFKSVGYARFGKDGSPHPYKSVYRRHNVVYVDSDKLVDVYSEVFGNRKDIIKGYGMSRLSNYFDNISSIFDEMIRVNSLIKDKKVILFSPTFRGTSHNDAYYDYDKIDLDKIYDFCKKNDFIFIIKMHPFIENKIKIKKDYSDLIFDYSDMLINDLIVISDIMITDYSSCVYEYSFFNRPIIFYRYDKSYYEYTKPVHTIDDFMNIDNEVYSFEELIKCLDKYKKIDISKRFDNIKKINNENNKIIDELR